MAPRFLADEALEITGFNKGLYKTAGAGVTGRLTEIFSNIVTVLTIFGGLAFLFWFVIGAFQWTSSGGNPEQMNKAKSQMSTAIAGLFVLVLSTSIIWILGKVTGLDIINLESLIKKVVP
ncbi:MAG: hypothetical protein Q8P47_01665 [Candidatus Beckwithbacteria bacterium]|nr:pilin [Patescibacteria group bacterium]MDP4030971.1 hypothetical protein [Candidatus Beckwithbacteria bacterium]